MKNIVSFIVILSVLGSCSLKRERTQMVERKLPVELFIDSFIKQYPDYRLNDITIQRTNEIFRKIVLDTLKVYDLLLGVPMRLADMNRVNNKTMVHFDTWIKPREWDYMGVLHSLNTDIIASVNDSLISVLKNDEYYNIHGKLIKRLNDPAIARFLFGRMIPLYTNSISIGKHDIFDDMIEVNLGILHYQIDSLSEFTGRDVDIVK
jgi:hypothetical protein